MSQTAAVTPVSQKEPDIAAHDANNFLHSNRNYEQTRCFPNARTNRGNIGHLQSGLDLPDGSQGIARDLADCGQRLQRDDFWLI